MTSEERYIWVSVNSHGIIEGGSVDTGNADDVDFLMPLPKGSRLVRVKGSVTMGAHIDAPMVYPPVPVIGARPPLALKLLAERTICTEVTHGTLCRECREGDYGCLRAWAEHGEWPPALSTSLERSTGGDYAVDPTAASAGTEDLRATDSAPDRAS